VLDLNGDGVRTSGVSHGVVFDVDHTGQPALTGWTDGKDGLLTLDLSRDGRINNGSELFGSGTDTAKGKAADGYVALRQHDGNGDGVIDVQDAVFKDLQVWVDGNVDGQTDLGELHSLAQLGIASLDLNALQGTHIDKGNTLGLVSGWTDVNGQVHDMADVWFSSQSLTDFVSQAEGLSKIDVSGNHTADVIDVRLSDVLAAAQKLVVVQADANDVVKLDSTGWVDTRQLVTVDNHSYELWSNATAHLLIDQQAKVHAVL